MKQLIGALALLMMALPAIAQAPVHLRYVPLPASHEVQPLAYSVPSLALLEREDRARAQWDMRERTGVFIDVAHDVHAAPRYLLKHSAQALGLYFAPLSIPEGDTLFIGSHRAVQVVTSVHSGSAFASVLWTSDTLWLAYRRHSPASAQPQVRLSAIHYLYAMPFGESPLRDFGDSDFCQVNVACPEGNGWRDAANAVVRILVRDGNDSFWCSGAMINNVRQDCKPYLLTAEHCSVSPTQSELNQWIFYFQYQSVDCNSPVMEGTLGSNYLTGATLVAQSNDNGGDFGSDFMLLELSSPLVPQMEAYLAGWDARDVAPASGVSIHHPSGDLKKISTFQQTATTTSFGGVAPNTHWSVNWVASPNGHGVTESGSSGAPLYNAASQIVGTLTGGTSFCNFTSGADEYGKMSHHWQNNGTVPTEQLRPWLDPDNTGAVTMGGISHESCLNRTRDLASQSTMWAFGLSPNPAAQRVEVRWTHPAIMAWARLLDASGRLVWEGNLTNGEMLELGDSPKGVYFLTLVWPEGAATQRLVKY